MIKKHRFQLWYYWLLAASLLNLAAGILIALAPGSILFEIHTSAIGETFFGDSLAEDAEQMRRFFFGIIGGTIAGYFLLQTMIVLFPFRKGERWAWHAIFWAILLWFIIDSTLSILHGAFFNVWLINVPALLIILLPLVLTHRYFGANTSPK
jgi:hypothetical protein